MCYGQKKRLRFRFQTLPNFLVGPKYFWVKKIVKLIKITHLFKKTKKYNDFFVLRFYSPVNPMGSCPAWSVYLTTLLPGRLNPQSS